jgi:CRP-like cAMP-binding protein
MSTIQLVLSSIPLFKGIATNELDEIGRRMTYRRYRRGEVVCSEGDSSHSLGLLLSGTLSASVLTTSGRDISLNFINSPAHFGELSAIDGLPRSATLTASKECHIGWISQRNLNELRLLSHTLNNNITVHLSKLVRACNQQILLLSNNSAVQRICLYLLNQPYTVSGGDIHIISKPSQQEIANHTNTARETVSRTLGTLQAKGIIAKQGKSLIIVNRESLEHIAADESTL